MCACDYSVMSDSLPPFWTIALQAPLSMGIFRQEYWNGLPFPTVGKLPDSGTKPESLVSPELAGRFFATSTPLMSLNLDVQSDQ